MDFNRRKPPDTEGVSSGEGPGRHCGRAIVFPSVCVICAMKFPSGNHICAVSRRTAVVKNGQGSGERGGIRDWGAFKFTFINGRTPLPPLFCMWDRMRRTMALLNQIEENE